MVSLVVYFISEHITLGTQAESISLCHACDDIIHYYWVDVQYWLLDCNS